MNMDRVDRIILTSKEDLYTLLKWRDNNKDLVREFKPSMQEGVIVFQSYKQYFKQEGKIISYKIWMGELEVMTLVIEKKDDGYLVQDVKHKFREGSKEAKEGIQDAVTVHASLMAYMSHYVHNVSERREQTIKTKKGKKNGNKKVKDRVVKLGRKVYSVAIPAAISTDKKPYERQALAWGVKGHLRTYKKSGKTIWIETYTKGDKNAEKEPKTYKL
jgi:hypothetical protein